MDQTWSNIVKLAVKLHDLSARFIQVMLLFYHWRNWEYVSWLVDPLEKKTCTYTPMTFHVEPKTIDSLFGKPISPFSEAPCSSFHLKRVTHYLAMDQYLLIPFLVGWTSIHQLFWYSPGVQGFDTLLFGKSNQKTCQSAVPWTTAAYAATKPLEWSSCSIISEN